MAKSWKLSEHTSNILFKAAAVLELEVDDLNQEFDDRSEKWQESDTGQETRAWIDDLEELATTLDNIEEKP